MLFLKRFSAVFLTFVVLLCNGVAQAIDTTFGEKVIGDWQGKIQPIGMPVVIHFKMAADKSYKGTLDSPSQNAFGMVLDQVEIHVDEVTAKSEKPAFSFHGKYNGKTDTLVGTWSQSGQTLALTLTRGSTGVHRPQEPKPPFPYESKEVSFQSKDNVTLSGTITSPVGAGPYRAVVLVSGSGPNTRDEPIFGHKPFLLLADWMSRHDIVVLRYDKRGTGKSTGDYSAAKMSNFADDASAAVDFISKYPNVDQHKIGLLGHSEGGDVAPMVATRRADIVFIAMLAGPVVTGYEILKSQYEYAFPDVKNRAVQLSILEVVRTTKDTAKLKEKVSEILKANGASAELIAKAMKQLTSPWFADFVSYDPAPTLKSLTCPVVAIYGEHDVQVPVKLNVPLINDIAAHNKNITVIVVPKANHLFQDSKTGAISEYGEIEQTMSPAVLEQISTWISQQ
jgi:hypothetical protein